MVNGMDIKKKKMYSEVYNIINLLGNEYIMKLPEELYKTLERERDTLYNPQYDLNKEITEQNISSTSLAMITLINLKYWCKDENEKEELKSILNGNEEKYQLEMKAKYDLEKVLYKKNNISNLEKENEMMASKNSLVKIKENLFTTILKKIKKFFEWGGIK